MDKAGAVLLAVLISAPVLVHSQVPESIEEPTGEAEAVDATVPAAAVVRPETSGQLMIGSLAGLKRPNGFIVEDLRSNETKASTPFRETFRAPPPRPFARAYSGPLAKYQRNIGEAELNISPVELLTERLISRYGDRLKGKRAKVSEFSLVLETSVDKYEGVNAVDPSSIGVSIVATLVGTAFMRFRNTRTHRVTVSLDAELDGKGIVAREQAVITSPEHVAALVDLILVRGLYTFDAQEPAESSAESSAEPQKAD